jgi:broad specificity phosphatase PhoE
VTTRLYLIRHGEHTLPPGTIAGRLPGVYLSERGKAQARALARRLERVKLAVVYASPLDRARQTAEFIAASHGLPVSLLELAIEIDFGGWEGKTFEELADDPHWRHWNETRSLARCPGGESMLEAQARIVDELGAVVRRCEGLDVAIVSHGDIIKAAVTWWLGMPLDLFQRLDIAIGSLTVAEFGGATPTLRSIGEVSAIAP